MAAVPEGGRDQEGFVRVGDTGVTAEVQQRADVVLDVPAVLAEEAVAEVVEGLTAGSGPGTSAIQEMVLELQQADRAVAGRQGLDSLIVKRRCSANIAASPGPRLAQCMSSAGPFRQTSMTRPTAIALRTAPGPEIPAFAQRSRWDSQERSSSPQLCRSPGQSAAGPRLESSVTQSPPSTAQALSQAFGR